MRPFQQVDVFSVAPLRGNPVAVVHDGATYAVMMASPEDLEDFAVGFSVSEGVISGPHDIAKWLTWYTSRIFFSAAQSVKR